MRRTGYSTQEVYECSDTPIGEWQIDHIQPKLRGGTGDSSNGQVLCRVRNRRKSDN
ncbi:HNH endonuclease signature motif containing protein [Actinomadura verrucosospora]|uniref:HNH endonuclease signature motif containing protein n=1 Tax=Actinomadura verrucosospora TaxID=46165 RepID=UPI0015657177